MDYREAWRRLKEHIERALDEGRDCGYDKITSEYFGNFMTYDRISRLMESLELAIEEVKEVPVMAKIETITDEMILFTDGSKITFDHDQDCCEYNYADFNQLDDIARRTDFDTHKMIFESVEDSGFRFGNENKMFFVPCYSEQNGYYSSDIDIYYNGEKVLNFCCEERFY